MKTKNIAMLINGLLEKEVGNVEGSDYTTDDGENGFLLEAENDEVKITIIFKAETKSPIK